MSKYAPRRIGRLLGLVASVTFGGLLLGAPLVQPQPAYAFDDRHEWEKRADERARERYKKEAEREREWHKKEAEREREWHKREAEQERDWHKREAEREREAQKHRAERARERWKHGDDNHYTRARYRRTSTHPDLDRDGVPNKRDRYPQDQRRH